MPKLTHKDINDRVMAKLNKTKQGGATARLQTLKKAASQFKGRPTA